MGVIVSGRCVDRHLPGGLEERTGGGVRVTERVTGVAYAAEKCRGIGAVLRPPIDDAVNVRRLHARRHREGREPTGVDQDSAVGHELGRARSQLANDVHRKRCLGAVLRSTAHEWR